MPWGSRRRRAIAVAGLAIVGVVAGCGDDTATSDEADPTGESTSTTVSAPSTTIAGGRLATVDFRNFTYDFNGAPPDGSDPAAVASPVAVVGGSFSDPEGSDDPLSAGRRFFVVTDVDYVDLDGDGEDEAAVSVLAGHSRSPARDTDVLVYRATDEGPAFVTDVGWSDREDGAVHDVTASTGSDGERLVVQLVEPIDEECCDHGIVERSFRLSGDRLAEDGDPTRWPVVGLEGTGPEPVAVSFLPGSQRASIGGVLTNDPQPVTFDAVEAQVLSVRARAVEDGDVPFTVTITGPDATVRSVAAGETVDAGLELSVSGTYVIAVVPDGPVADESPDTGQRFWLDFVLSD